MSLTPFDLALDADTSLVTADVYGPGTSVLIRAEDGTEHPVRALFEQAGAESGPGSVQSRVITSVPMLHIQLSVVQHALGRPLSQRDRFVIGSVIYRPQAPVQDGYGLYPIKLQEVKDVTP